MNFRMTIGNKLLLSFGALIVVTLVLSASALKAISGLRESFDLAINQTVEKIVLAGAINTAESDMMAAQRGMVQFTFAKDVARADTSRMAFAKTAGEAVSSLAATDVGGLRGREASERSLLNWTHGNQLSRR